MTNLHKPEAQAREFLNPSLALRARKVNSRLPKRAEATRQESRGAMYLAPTLDSGRTLAQCATEQIAKRMDADLHGRVQRDGQLVKRQLQRGRARFAKMADKPRGDVG